MNDGPDNLLDAFNPGASADSGIALPWKPASRPGGGAALAPRGGSGNGAQSATIAAIQGRSPLPGRAALATGSNAGASSAAGGSAALLAAVAGATGPATQPTAPSVDRAPAAPAQPSPVALAPSAATTGNTPLPSPSGGSSLSSIADLTTGNASGPSQGDFPYFALYVLDNNDGVVLMPGVDQLANLGKNVDLEAQVSGATVSAYSWDTSGITSDAGGISGTSTYNLTFHWNNMITTAHVDTITLAVTDTSSQIETYTYDFFLPAGSGPGGSGGSNATWPSTYAPNTIGSGDPAWSSDGARVDSNSGALDTTIPLPSYNPNVGALALTYDSQAANPAPIIIAENTLSSSSAVPSKVAATLTFNGTAGTTYYYGTSTLNPGDIEQVALQAGTGTSTGRYSYSVQLVDEYSTPTTTTYTGTATVLAESNGFGPGWTLSGLERIITATGGVILDEGGGDDSLWFSGSFPNGGGTYTSPAGDFSTLAKNGSTGYTRTLPDGTQITFNSAGYETASIDRNALHTTYSYNGSNQLSTVKDPYGGLTTFTYGAGGGTLQTIKDPAGRLTTFTFSGGNLQAVEQADSSFTTYTYNGSNAITQIKDPLGNVVSIVYDSAERVGTIVRPDSSTQEFGAVQEQGWTNSGTSGSPAPATLMAAAAASYTSPNGNTSALRPDWYGLGQTGVAVDALGNVATYDVNSNGLATVAVDPLNRIASYTYDSKGNMTEEVYPDGNSDQYTYNGFSEPLTHTNANGKTTSYTYDSAGNNTVIQDPMNNRTTMTYTGNGRLQTLTNADDYTTTYQYDSQDRLTTVTNPDSTTEKYSYNSQGNVTQLTDERGNSTTYAYDGLNRETGTTDPLSNHATIQYDADGNQIAVTDPLNHTTSYSYDSMNRLATVTTPLGYQTVSGYDADGNRTTVTDPLSRVTTTTYDALDRRPIVVTDPMSNATTMTYDADGEVIQTEDALDRITTTTYNNRGWVATVTDPMGNTVTYSYTATGQQASGTIAGYSGGGVESYDYTYNADDELVTVTDPLSNVTTYSYDGLGNKIAITDANNQTTSYAYDSRDQLTTITDPLGDTTVYGYDGEGNQTTVTDGLGHTTTTLYDSYNRATTMTSAIGGTTTITYDGDGRQTSLTDPDGNKTEWAYDSDGRMTTQTNPNAATVTNVYDHDDELTDTTDADGRRTTYAYNADGDQTGETWLNNSGGAIYQATFTYDADNEMIGADDPYATLTFTYNADGELQTDATSGPGSGQPSVLLSYTYDPAGNETSVTDNLSSQGVTSYTYNAGEQVAEIATSYGGTAGPEIDYTYTPDGQISQGQR